MTSDLHHERLDAVQRAVSVRGARKVLDLGCGDGDLLTRLAGDEHYRRLVGVDPSREALRRLRDRLDGLVVGEKHCHVELVHGSMTEALAGLIGFDCATLVESIEHVDPRHLSLLERALFESLRPAAVVMTTPNADFNPLLGLPPGEFRHPGHRFEWGRAKFRGWCRGVAARNDYHVACSDLAGVDAIHGGASQMAVFDRPAKAAAEHPSRHP